jgi:hypothetical protein
METAKVIPLPHYSSLVEVSTYGLRHSLLWGVLFNPVFPIMLPPTTFVMLELVSLVLFAASLAALKRIPRQSIASITDRTPGSQSL